jgi:hypothetical protein
MIKSLKMQHVLEMTMDVLLKLITLSLFWIPLCLYKATLHSVPEEGGKEDYVTVAGQPSALQMKGVPFLSSINYYRLALRQQN